MNNTRRDLITVLYIFTMRYYDIIVTQFNSIRESRKGSDKLNPYIVLESNPNDDLLSIRKKYLKLSKENHPDLLVSKGVPQEVIDESKMINGQNLSFSLSEKKI